jgi:hypothetical protein
MFLFCAVPQKDERTNRTNRSGFIVLSNSIIAANGEYLYPVRNTKPG